MLPNKNARSIARVALAEQSLACTVRAQTVLRFLQKLVARRVIREREEVHKATERLRQLKKSRFGLAATRLDLVCS